MEAETVLVCSGCDRGIEVCAFCDADGCEQAICYRCVILELGETTSQPHEHGG